MTTDSIYCETLHAYHPKLLCWKSIFAGVLISILTYLILTSLGTGIGGSTAEFLINNEESGAKLATGACLWLGLSAVISLFIGSYFGVRASKFVTTRIGITHGIVISSIFFILLIWEMGSAVGHLYKGIHHTAFATGNAAVNLTKNPLVQDAVQKALGTSTLKSNPQEVVQGLVSRLVLSSPQSAKDYLAYETGATPAEVDAKIAQLKKEFDETVKQAGEKTAAAVADTGWSLFVTFIVGLLGAIIGGRTAAVVNQNRPLGKYVINNEKGSALPYIFGWLLGVPGSILFLIFLCRNI